MSSSRPVLAIDRPQEQLMSNGTITHHGFAGDDFDDYVHLLIGKDDAHTLAQRAWVAADRDELPVIIDANRNIAGETENPFNA